MTKVLPLGAVVMRMESNGKVQRGVVIWSNGRGEGGHYRMLGDESYVIQMVPGLYSVGNMVEDWYVIPEDEWTTSERVLGASVSWERPDWKDDEDSLQEYDDYGFACMRALLPPSVQDVVFGDGDWPMTYQELALFVADWMDDKMKAQRALGAALAR